MYIKKITYTNASVTLTALLKPPTLVTLFTNILRSFSRKIININNNNFCRPDRKNVSFNNSW